MKRNTKLKQNEIGITLIALVITIIVLLILAGVAIATLTGDNGVLRKVSSSKIKNEQATVKEQIILAYGEYQIEIQTSSNKKLASINQNLKLADESTITEPAEPKAKKKIFLGYLEKDKQVINSDGIVDVKKLTGNKMTLGNGTSGKSDVYIISLDEEENRYVLNYYDANENETFLWETNADDNKNAVKINISKTPDTEKTLAVQLKVTSVEGMLPTVKSDEAGRTELLQKIENMRKEDKEDLLKKLWIIECNVSEGTSFTTFEELLKYRNEQDGTNFTEDDVWNIRESYWNSEGITINEDIAGMTGGLFYNEETGKVELAEITNPAGNISDTYIARENGTYTFTVKDLITEKTYKKSVEVSNIDKTLPLPTYYNEIEYMYMIAPQDLFDYKIINNNEKEAKITRIKPQYANGGGYNPDTDKCELTNTHYGVVYEGTAIKDILVVPYQVEIDGELFEITEVDLTIKGAYPKGDGVETRGTGSPEIETIVFPNTVRKALVGGKRPISNNATKRVVLPDKLTEIPSFMFEDFNDLTSINIPNGVTSIGERAFSGCESLASITIPESVQSIDSDAFGPGYEWTRYTTVKLKKGSPLASNIPQNKWGAKEVILID